MSDNSMWIRYFRLTVQKQRDRIAEFLNGSYLGNDAALDLSSFHVQFEISQALLNRPCTATVTIFNISAQTAAQINVKDNPLLIIEAAQRGEGSYLLVESAKIGCTELLKNLEKSREREQSDH